MKFTRWLLLLLLLITLAFGVLAYWMHAAISTPVAHSNADKYVTIDQGVGSNRILQILEESDIIQAPLATKLYLRFFDQGKNSRQEIIYFPRQSVRKKYWPG